MTEQTRILKARRLALSLGFRITKHFNKTFGEAGFMLIDETTNVVVAGAYPVDFSLTLDELEAELRERQEAVNNVDIDVDDDFDQF